MAKPPNTTTAPTGQIAPFGLRMLPDLREQIAEAARQSGRSMNAEVIARLETSFSDAASPALAAELARAEAAVESLKRIDAISSATTSALAQYVVTLHERLGPKVRDELNTSIAYRLALALLNKDGAGLADVFGDLFADDLTIVSEMHRLKNEFGARQVEVKVRGKKEVINIPAMDTTGLKLADGPLRLTQVSELVDKPAPGKKTVLVGNIGRLPPQAAPASKAPANKGPERAPTAGKPKGKL